MPLEHGGRGLTLRETASLLIELATADSNVAQALRGHFAFVEDQLSFPPSPERDGWLRRLAAGELVGNAWSEIGTAAVGVTQTTLTRRGDELVVNGTKYYSTGTIFTDWTDVVVRREDGTDTAVVVRVDQPGVVATDDWSGFGQRLSGSSSTCCTARQRRPSGWVRTSQSLSSLPWTGSSSRTSMRVPSVQERIVEAICDGLWRCTGRPQLAQCCVPARA